jgi:hypothetical protein
MRKTKMNKTIFGVVMILVLVLCVSAVHAELDNLASISLSLVNQDPDPAVAGDTVEIRIGIQNIGGGAVDNLTAELVPAYPFTLLSGDSAVQNIGAIQGYQGYYESSSMKIIKYKVRVDKDAIAGSYDLKIKYYDGILGNMIEKSLAIDVKGRENAEIIHIDKTTLIPGHQSSLKFSINNVGNAPLRDLTFSWENTDDIILPVGSDNTRYINYIDVGESAEIEYQVIADTNADPGLYKLNLYLTYENSFNGSTKKISTIAGIYVGGGTDFDVAFSESSSDQISFSVANIGSNPAFSVSVIIPQQEGWSVTGSNSMIIGNLNTGDYTVASFTLQSTQASAPTMPQVQSNQTDPRAALRRNATAQNANALKVQVAYTDTMGTRSMVEKEVAMNQQSSTGSNSTSLQAGGAAYFRTRNQESFFSKYKWYIVGFVLVLVLGALYGKYRKGKMLDPSFRMKDVFRKKDVPAGKKK